MTIKYFHHLSFFTLLVFTSAVAANPMQKAIEAIETDIDGRVGIAIMNIHHGAYWSYKGDERFPMMSTFKALACAKLFHDAAAGNIDVTQAYPIAEKDLIVWSPVTKNLIGKSINLKQACEATMLTSDNTAANIVLSGIGGPDKLTAFLKSIGDDVTRLDRIEPELNQAKLGDIRDTTMPNAMVQTLNNLLLGDTLTKASSHQITNWMTQNKISGKLLRSVLPTGWSIADRTGSGENGSRGITALIWKSTHNKDTQQVFEKPPIILAIYITETQLSHAERNKVIAKIGKLLFAEFLK